MVEYIILSKLIKAKNEREVVHLLKKIAVETSLFKEDYPDYVDWFWEKQVHGLFEGNRDIIIAVKENKIIGISNIKNTILEKKICTLSVDKRYRMKNIGSKLVEISLELLDTKTPIITMNLYKLPEFSAIIKKYNWVITSCQKDIYKEDTYEVFFNDNQLEDLNSSSAIVKELNYNIYKIWCYYLLKKYRKCKTNNYYQINLQNLN